MEPARQESALPEIAPPAWPRGAGHVRIDRTLLYPLLRRVQSAVLLKILLLIENHTRSWPDSPEFAEISMQEWCQYTGASERSIELQIAAAERLGWIRRERPDQKHNRGGYRLVPEKFADTPIPAPRQRKCKPRSATVTAPAPIAAMHQVATAVAQLVSLPSAAPPAVEGSSPGEPTASPDLRVSSDIRPIPQLVSLTDAPAAAQPDSEDSQFVTVRVHRSAFEAASNCPQVGGCPLVAVSSKHLEANKACLPSPEPAARSKEAGLLNQWLSYQPWGKVNSMTRRGLTETQVECLLAELDQAGRTAVEFVEHHMRSGTIVTNPENIIGLMISLIRALPPNAYSAQNRESNRLMRAADIVLPPIDSDEPDGPPDQS